MIGDRVAKTIRSGTRLTLIRLRRVIVTLSETVSARVVIDPPPVPERNGVAVLSSVSSDCSCADGGRGLVGLVGRGAVLGGVPREGEEDVVQVGPAQPDVQYPHRGVRQPAERLGEGLGATRDRQRQPSGLLVPVWLGL